MKTCIYHLRVDWMCYFPFIRIFQLVQTAVWHV